MTPAELKPIVKAWGGSEKFARVLDVSKRTVDYWLAGRPISPPVARLIRMLDADRKKTPNPRKHP